MVRYEPNGTVTVIAEKFQGKRLNSPNDIVVHPDGGIWFTDPAYGASLSEGRPDAAGGPTNPEGVFNPAIGTQGLADPAIKRELPNGVYRIDPNGRIDLAIGEDQLKSPNGLCFSPDESLLYINDTTRAHIRVFDVGPGHELSNGRVLAENIGEGDLAKGGLVDGMKLDERGNVYVTGPGGVWIISPHGEHLGVIEVPEDVGNVNWGGDDWRTLFIPASTSVYSVRLNVGGNRLGYMR